MSNLPMSVSVKFRWGLSSSDPEQTPVMIVGQVPHLNSLSWTNIKNKLEPHVTEEAWLRGVSCVTQSAGECVELWPRAAVLASLPARRSRHAAPARAHALAKLVRNNQRTGDEFIVLVCRKRDVYASAIAIARSYPIYSARSGLSPLPPAPATPPQPAKPRAVMVEIHLVPDDNGDGDSEDEGLAPIPPELVDETLSSDELETIQNAADAVRLAASIADTPCNIMNVDKFIEVAIKVASDLNIEPPTIIRGEELKTRGMGGIYGVGAGTGSISPPALVTLSYKPASSSHTVAFVGKGIVFDTGGLCIKSRDGMVSMKNDCAGAAGVLGAFAVLARAQPTVTLHCVLCLAENSVGPLATRPDDIHQLYSGRTVEINNTDAEGRLVLSDGVVYAARDLKADTVVDMATLTGAQGSATGKYHAAIVSNRMRMEAACICAGLRSADLAHALPFAPEMHFQEFSSVIADMKNSVAGSATGKYHAAIVSNRMRMETACICAGLRSADLAHALPFAPEMHFQEFSSVIADMKNHVADRNNAQSSCAGLFILAHLGFDFPGAWLHIDMASPAICGERATGYGVGLLSVLFGFHTENKLLRALSPGPLVQTRRQVNRNSSAYHHAANV